MISFVKKVEGSENQECDVPTLTRIAKEFSSTWRSGVEVINSEIFTYFSSYENGREILCQTLAQLVLYYTRFQVYFSLMLCLLVVL